MNNEKQRQALQETLHQISDWSYTNELKLNSEKKFHVTHYKHRTQTFNFIYHLHRTQIKRVREMRDLGVLYDSHLTFIPHIEDLRRRSACISGALNRFVKEVGKPELTQRLTDTMIRPILEHGFVVWAGRNIVQEIRFDAILHKSTRTTLRLPYFRLAQRYQPFEERMRRLDSLTYYGRLAKYKKGNSTVPYGIN